jgi:hypothetical protein
MFSFHSIQVVIVMPMMVMGARLLERTAGGGAIS